MLGFLYALTWIPTYLCLPGKTENPTGLLDWVDPSCKSHNWFLQLQSDMSVCFLSSATGFDGEQALGVQLLQLGRRKRRIIHGEPLPLSRQSHLSWLGFTAEGQFLKTDLMFKNTPSSTSCVSFWVPQEPRAMWIQTGWSGC